MTEPNFRAHANRIMGCQGMEEDSWREEIIATLEAIPAAGTIEKLNIEEKGRG